MPIHARYVQQLTPYSSIWSAPTPSAGSRPSLVHPPEWTPLQPPRRQTGPDGDSAGVIHGTLPTEHSALLETEISGAIVHTG